MFRDDLQVCKAIGVVLSTARMGRFWGPTDEAVAFVDQGGGPLSSGERVMLLAAFALWNGRGGLELADVIASLDLEPAEALCTLIVAVKREASAVDAWIASKSTA